MIYEIEDKKLVVTINTEYTRYDDDESEDDICSGDYSSVSVLLNGEEFTSFGSYYDDKGSEKAEAVADTFKLLFGDKKVVVIYKDVVIEE